VPARDVVPGFYTVEVFARRLGRDDLKQPLQSSSSRVSLRASPSRPRRARIDEQGLLVQSGSILLCVYVVSASAMSLNGKNVCIESHVVSMYLDATK
jgi:hypothetical protein